MIKVGDTVRFLNEKGEGVIKEFISAVKARIEISKGIEIEVPIKELVPIPHLTLKDMKVSSKEATGHKSAAIDPKKSKAHATDVIIVDLHIEKLADDYYGLTNSQKLDIQVSHFRKKLERAVNGHINTIVFIHGVGNGVLRQAVRDLLKTYEGIQYSDASYKQFGAGATEVRIISRNKVRASL